MMKAIKSKAFVLGLAFASVLGATAVYADESVGEKAAATANDAKRAVKKGAHRVEEATCMQDDVKCAEKKAEHRAQEAVDYTKDKAKEVKNTVDSDDKK